MKKYLQLPLLALCAFAGGFTAQALFTAAPSQAAQIMSYFTLGDSQNSKGLELYVHQGGPAQNFYGADGKIRLQMGTYTAPGEKGLPLISLNDNSGNIRILMRLAGSNEAPVLIFKDKNQHDRMVMGLSLNGTEEPFLATYDSNGSKTNVFGNY
jgi:hypothetical protein